MKQMKQVLFLSVGVGMIFFIVGCAATYKPPTTAQVDFARSINASKDSLFDTSKKVLAMAGYQIQNSDKDAGIITTSFRQMRLDETQCDCGTTMGLSYIKDKRTVTNVAMSMIVDDNKITIKANITGEYLKGADITQSISFDCVSTGVIEQGLFDKIRADLI